MDPLSDVLALLGARSFLSAQLTAGGDWAIRFSETVGIKFNAVLQGSCWLLLDDGERASPRASSLRIAAGDGFLFAHGHSYILASDPSLPAVPAREVFAHAVDGRASHGDRGDGTDVVILGGRVTLDEADAALLLDLLPPLFRLPAGSPEAQAVAWLVPRLGQEVAATRPGSALASDHLTHLLFVEFLRAYVAGPSRPERGWLAALADPRIGKALQRIHAEPARRWTLPELASLAGMSRSSFALHWKRLVGTAPLDYLLDWRMRLAKKTLRSGHASIASVAASLGYESESAFSNAFKRVVGKAPLHYRQSIAAG